jgi:hypothetical protein
MHAFAKLRLMHLKERTELSHHQSVEIQVQDGSVLRQLPGTQLGVHVGREIGIGMHILCVLLGAVQG